MSLRKGIGFCQQSEPSLNKDLAFNFISKNTFNKLGYKAKINTHTTSYIN